MPAERTAATADDEEKLNPGTDAGDAFDDEIDSLVTDALEDDDDEEDDLEDDDDDDDLDDEDDDEDLDDDDDDDDVDDEEEGGQPRDEQGKFAPKDGAAAAGDKPADGAAAAAAGAPAAAADKPAAGEAAKTPAYETLKVKSNGEDVSIDEARISRANGYAFIAMKESDLPRFTSRLSRGIAGEKMWRQMAETQKELEARKNAPPPKSDAQIEAEITLEAVKPFLSQFLDDKDVELLEAKIELAKHTNKTEYAAAEEKRIAAVNEPSWEETQTNGLVDTMVGLVNNFPELQALTPEQLEEVYSQEFLPIRQALYYREGDDVFANTQVMYDRLKARATAIANAAKPAPTDPAKANDPATANKPADKAERFNRGVDAGKKPGTTSVKANRGKRPAEEATTRRGRRGKGRRSERSRAEDKWRKTERAYLNSPTLDFDEGDEEA